ncbi:hypothetical protein QEH56_08900 [Pelagicoccus enzymogenes]|uniref:hypothetical protein n=1 Tax=Pelagicoccus enzymogenes TaxID=2773457 RepID=UPI00280DF630|nr:hypothetical protein [Pelagicoccus enzymogenes]MDQ8198262.1 hypothetical protein [Pelagicoccus enzymogenes]
MLISLYQHFNRTSKTNGTWRAQRRKIATWRQSRAGPFGDVKIRLKRFPGGLNEKKSQLKPKCKKVESQQFAKPAQIMPLQQLLPSYSQGFLAKKTGIFGKFAGKFRPKIRLDF